MQWLSGKIWGTGQPSPTESPKTTSSSSSEEALGAAKSPQQARLNKLNDLLGKDPKFDAITVEGVGLRVTTAPDGKIKAVSGKRLVSGEYALTRGFYTFLQEQKIEGIEPVSIKSGKVIGLTAKDEKAFNALLNAYADKQKVDKGAFPRISSVAVSPAESPRVSPKASPTASPKTPSPVGTPVARRSVELKKKEEKAVGLSDNDKKDIDARLLKADIGLKRVRLQVTNPEGGKISITPEESADYKGAIYGYKDVDEVFDGEFLEFLQQQVFENSIMVPGEGLVSNIGIQKNDQGKVRGFTVASRDVFDDLLDKWDATSTIREGKKKDKAEKKEVAEALVFTEEDVEKINDEWNEGGIYKDEAKGDIALVAFHDQDENSLTIRGNNYGGDYNSAEGMFSKKFAQFLAQQAKDKSAGVTIEKNAQGGIESFTVSSPKAFRQLVEDFKTFKPGAKVEKEKAEEKVKPPKPFISVDFKTIESPVARPVGDVVNVRSPELKKDIINIKETLRTWTTAKVNPPADVDANASIEDQQYQEPKSTEPDFFRPLGLIFDEKADGSISITADWLGPDTYRSVFLQVVLDKLIDLKKQYPDDIVLLADSDGMRIRGFEVKNQAMLKTVMSEMASIQDEIQSKEHPWYAEYREMESQRGF